MRQTRPFCLASASPRRKALLAQLGLTFEVAPTDEDETRHPGEPPPAYSLRIAENKARSALARFPEHLILAGDTVVVLGEEVLGKPATPAEATELISRLTARHAVRDARRVATTLGYGPRFLHSTGQLHKGGPNNGLFLQITSDDKEDSPVPGQKYTFGILKRFQAQGDFEVLAERQRRLLRVHLGADVPAGLARLRDLIRAALA